MSKICSVILITFVLFNDVYGYCQPDEPCWPTQEEIEVFAASLTSSGSQDCLQNVPTFTSFDEQGDLILNEWYPDQPIEITPYMMMNLRTYVSSSLAYFVVLARNDQDVSNSVLFATRHNIAISVMSTGHEFQDRNAGLAPNSLLIRTTCLRDVEFDLSPNNKFGHEGGIVKMGAGLTWGKSKFNMKGAQAMAEENGRVLVSGHAANVGIVGWSLGGGHGQLVPLHGMGVDQMLEVDLISADGSFVTANEFGTKIISSDGTKQHFTENADLFWALRGGGGSTWGVILSLTVKLHLPRNNCTNGCYIEKNRVWGNIFAIDDGKMAEEILHTFLSWSSQASKYWSAYGTLFPGENGSYGFAMTALYVGNLEDDDGGDLSNFDDWFNDVYPDNIIYSNESIFDTFYQKLLAQDPEDIYTTFPWSNMLSVLIKDDLTADYDVAKGFVDNWIPRCYRLGTSCAVTIMFLKCQGRTYYDAEGMKNTSISNAMKSSYVHVVVGDIINLLEPELTHEDKFTFVHETLAPEIYKFGEGSYFSESEYTMSDWQTRFWGQENYQKLAAIKQTWDPNHVFGCRHCIGEDLES